MFSHCFHKVCRNLIPLEWWSNSLVLPTPSLVLCAKQQPVHTNHPAAARFIFSKVSCRNIKYQSFLCCLRIWFFGIRQVSALSSIPSVPHYTFSTLQYNVEFFNLVESTTKFNLIEYFFSFWCLHYFCETNLNYEYLLPYWR